MPVKPSRKTATVIPISKAKGELSEVVTQVRVTGQRVVLSRHGKHVAAIVPLADYDKLVAA